MQAEQESYATEPPWDPERFLSEEKGKIRTRSWWAIGIGLAIVLLHVLGFLLLRALPTETSDFDVASDGPLSWKLLFRSIFFILGLLAVMGGVWGLYYARHLTLKEIIPSEEAARYISEGQAIAPYYSYTLIAGIVVVTIAQLATGLGRSIELAGFVKPDFVGRHEYWRILTGAVLHGGFLHIYFNSQALYGFGNLIEKLSNRAHLPIVFLLAAVGGGLLSLVFMSAGTSVGASGGIMGMIGYMAIFGYRRKHQLPPDFMKSMLINIGFIAAIGIIGYQLIDNFAHLGGLIAGGVYGLLQIPSDPSSDPRQAGSAFRLMGLTATGAVVAICLFALYILLS